MGADDSIIKHLLHVKTNSRVKHFQVRRTYGRHTVGQCGIAKIRAFSKLIGARRLPSGSAI